MDAEMETARSQGVQRQRSKGLQTQGRGFAMELEGGTQQVYLEGGRIDGDDRMEHGFGFDELQKRSRPCSAASHTIVTDWCSSIALCAQGAISDMAPILGVQQPLSSRMWLPSSLFIPLAAGVCVSILFFCMATSYLIQQAARQSQLFPLCLIALTPSSFSAVREICFCPSTDQHGTCFR